MEAQKFAIGYRLPDGDVSIAELAIAHRERVSDVYFALPGAPSGRSPLGLWEGYSPQALLPYMVEELRAVRDAGIGLTLLHNASCYGPAAASHTLADRLVRETGAMLDQLDITAVTTASPFAARILREAFPHLELRASVNLRLGTVSALELCRDFFDGFYLQREYNRDLRHIQTLRRWCDSHGKKLYMLVNSGCFAWCPFQTFHDNLVSHEGESDPGDFAMAEPSYCRELMRDPGRYAEYLRATWVRPEDLRRYAGLLDGYKLATRLHPNPGRILEAYLRGSFSGSISELTEPGFPMGGLYLDNTRFPSDWFDRTEGCGRDCAACGYCDRVLEQIAVRF